MRDAPRAIMNSRSVTNMVVVIALSVGGCATTTTERTTYHSPPDTSGHVAIAGMRFGTVDAVEAMTESDEGSPVDEADADELAGGLIFRSGGGAAGGAIAGTAMSSRDSERQTYAVIVRFDDGQTGQYTYQGEPPFSPGERVVLTSDGLRHAE